MAETVIEIAERKIGRHYPPFIIAEMSGNHNQSLERALEIVEAAAKTGAHALKIQTYTPDAMKCWRNWIIFANGAGSSWWLSRILKLPKEMLIYSLFLGTRASRSLFCGQDYGRSPVMGRARLWAEPGILRNPVGPAIPGLRPRYQENLRTELPFYE